MSFLGNVLWLIFGGLVGGLGYIIGGFVLCLTIVGIPFGIQSIKLGVATLCPFGKTLHTAPDADSPLRLVFNIIWLLCFGWGIALCHLASAAVCAVTIIGIPFAVQHIKLLPMALFPLGRELR
jgi:uncharacterized membrane protein YccF (DUF307 family)